MRNLRWICVFLFGAIFFDSAFAQTTAIAPGEELGKKIRAASGMRPLSDTPFGEEISSYDGTLSFRQTDIDQPGLGLPLQLTRTFRTDDARRDAAFMDWKLEIPHIETLSAEPGGSESNVSGWFFLDDANRCSNFRQAPAIVLSTGGSPVPIFYLPGNWWNGYQLMIPGMGAQDLLLRDSSNTASPLMPADGGGLRTFPIVTKKNWMVSCLASTSNGKPGEGFLVVSPDGVKYWMDWLTHKRYRKVGFAQPGFGGVGRRIAMMMVSRVEDRFGNSLSYSYDANGDLASIQANDGRRLVLTYESWTGGEVSPGTRIRTASLSANDAPSRTWTYTYNATSQSLLGIVQPDGGAWSFNLGGFHYTWGATPLINYGSSDGCTYDVDNSQSYFMQGEITHPSGLLGEFNLKLVMRGRSYVPLHCTSSSAGHRSLDIANAYTVAAMNQKKISGPGVSAQVWNYNYSPANQSWASDCGSGCATTVWTDVTDPAGKAVRYTFSNRYDVSEGRLLRKDYFSGASGSSVARTEEYTYANATAGPWPLRMGIVRQPNVNKDQLEQLAPVVRNVVVQDGTTFTRAIEQLDSFARPVRVARSSSLGYSRADVTAYHDNTTKWVLGQTAKVTCVAPTTALPAGCGAPGTIVSETTYDTSAQPATISSFGKLQQSLTYNVNGTIATVKDGNNNVTALSNWKRGIPQTIQFPITPESPSGATQLATVNDNGWITSITDENNFTTAYGYDLMGRLDSIVYPTGDTTGWNDTTFTWEYRNIAEHGLPAGHWLRSQITGNGYKNVFFDALWRPVLIHEFDAANISGTLRATSTEYDSSGRVAFQSYPSSSTIPAAFGTWTRYDALDRVTSVKQDSELGQLTTTTEYLPGFQTLVTNPRQKQTLTVYRAYDQPSYDQPHGISELGGDRHTEIYRDVFGKPYQVRRRNDSGSESAWRYYVYDGYQQLCKTVEPETGATVMDYDGAGNLQWSAAGTGLTSTSSCDTIAGRDSGRKVTRHYDSRNRLAELLFPDGRGNQLRSYTPDGLAAQITTWNHPNSGGPVVNTYNYNKRRMLTGESTQQPNWYSWGFGYGYDANASLSMQSYPTGLVVGYAPNALGQPTWVHDNVGNTYASGLSYYPNGAIKQFTYGNGIVHTMTQNTRQLPERATDVGVQDMTYAYDANGNTTTIRDVNAVQYAYSGNRDLVYDGLDRLTQAHLHWWQVDDWTYDALDNIRSKTHFDGSATTTQNYTYDGSNRLVNIQENGATTVGLEYDEQGNLKNKNGFLYQFDYGNRLRSNSQEQGFTYDGHGRRASMTRGFMNPRYRKFAYSQSGQLLHEENTATNSESDHIYLSGSLLASRSKIYTIPNGQWGISYAHTDALGSPVAKTDQTGVVQDRTSYESYGGAINKPTYEGIGFTGHVQDSASGLTYMQQRYYDPAIGRFLSVDPVTASSGTGANFNRYWYANNNPYRFTDPDGREAVRCDEYQCKGSPNTIAEWIAAPITIGIAYAGRLLSNELPIAQQSEGSTEPETSPSPPAPGNLVGTENSLGGQQGKRVNNGPLTPANGGTGDGETDFENLTGGQSGPAPEGMRLPEGSKVGENGIIFRPGSESKGARIDIPANGDKPHETLHYPVPPPPQDLSPYE